MSAPGHEALRERVEGRQWYHSVEVSPGIVTPGWFDLRSFAAQDFPWPDLAGKRCLDVGTFDGFWGFEMERRGAKEVVSVDVLDPAGWDWPVSSDDATIHAIAQRHERGLGFEIAKEALGSSVTRFDRSVQDLDAADLGAFDFVFMGSLLVHLKSPVEALERVRGVCQPGATFVSVDAIDYELTLLLRSRPVAKFDGMGRPWWWKPNLAGLEAMIRSAGFTPVQPGRVVFLQPGAGFEHVPASWRNALTPAGREGAVIRRRGDPHGLVVAKPS